MKKLICIFLLCSLTICRVKAQVTEPVSAYVKVETNMGNFTVALYEGTPLHRDNFLSLVKSHAYEGTIFHRVIERFMVQGGNLLTKGATKATDVGRDTVTGLIPIEANPTRFYHKRGALAAARLGDEVNPTKGSSKTQFYVVTGTYFTDLDLDAFEQTYHRKLTPEQRETYKMLGGTPHLDGEYTVFGEVVDGYKTIEKIERVKTGPSNRPLKDIIIKKTTIVGKPR